jgi:hypothetical protein
VPIQDERDHQTSLDRKPLGVWCKSKDVSVYGDVLKSFPVECVLIDFTVSPEVPQDNSACVWASLNERHATSVDDTGGKPVQISRAWRSARGPRGPTM